ncbi:MAG: GTP 3',8-cyclase MoaA, partial [Gammaproteobacteria bacterium]|nr:GTP 3',8-cyclase MoaA [Gammaproteobacteria bacterium]
NAVVKRGINDATVVDMVERFRGTGTIVRFIEYMDVGTINHWKPSETVPARELLERINARWALEPVAENYHGEVASRYRFADGAGEIGFINSVTEPFCGSCTRARLSSDGKLFTCLFAAHGLDLREPLRSGVTDAELLELVRTIWSNRTDRYSELRARDGAPADKVEMYYIGG